MRPIIGLLTEIDNECMTKVQHAYVSAIERSGGVPLVLPYVRDDEIKARYVELCDGFFFTGGVDVDPVHYGEEKSEFCGEIQPSRDEFEFSFLKKAFASNKPILAVCRGAQLVNVALGGTLYQDIPSELDTRILHQQTEEKFSPSHSVNVVAGTPLYELVGKKRMIANSFHHQAIKTIGTGLLPMAYADDRIIEAVYYTGHRYLRAYQWHPERLCGMDENNKKILDEFIKISTKGE